MYSSQPKQNIYASSGYMPVDYLLRKQEVTCEYMPETLVEDYQRSALKDRRPLKPLFESDEIAGGRDVAGNAFGNPNSDRILSFHNSGFQTESDAEPYLPDGTFINIGATELDPRGVALGPNMRAGVDQQWARGDLYNYRSDADPSVPESGINPWQMNNNVRNIQRITKDYFKNFSTGYDAWATSSIAPGYTKSNKQKVRNDQVIKDPKTAPNRNKLDATTALSNTLNLGWRRTTDNRFQVSKYGRKNVGKTFTGENWYKNRANTNVDHDVMVSWQDTNVSKATALKMIDLSKQKSNAIAGLREMQWEESSTYKPASQKLQPKDMAGMAKRPSHQTHDAAAHTTLNGEVMPDSGERRIQHDAPVMGKIKLNTTIFEKMGQLNKAVTKEQKNDLRVAIKESAVREKFSVEEHNPIAKKSSKNNKAFWNSIAVYNKGDEKIVINYAAAKSQSNVHNLKKISKHVFDRDSHNADQRRGKLKTRVGSNKAASRGDNDFGREGVHTRFIGGLGTKYLADRTLRDTPDNELGDISAQTRR
jgi:hypothetical protein